MACCLVALSHYLNQCWFLINDVLWHSSGSNFTVCAQVTTVDSCYLAPVGGQNSQVRVKWFSRYLAKAQTRDFQDQSPTLWCLHLLNPNSMLSDNGCTYILRISADMNIAPATNHNKPYYILIIMHQNCQITCCIRRHTMESVLKPSKPRCGLTGNRNGIAIRRGFHRYCMSFLMKNSRITFQITLISALLVW